MAGEYHSNVIIDSLGLWKLVLAFRLSSITEYSAKYRPPVGI